jgi:hypothetical protein
MELKLERKTQRDDTLQAGGLALSPRLGENYWVYRVRVGGGQAILGFPKFRTIAVGFAIEDYDHNTNLPFRCSTAVIWEHIRHNRGPATATVEEMKAAIELICEAAATERGEVRDFDDILAQIPQVTKPEDWPVS